MNKIFKHLKPGGKFLFDVFSMAKYNSFQEMQTWEICHNGGFWCKDSYVVLNGCYKYSDHVTLEQISVISNNNITPYYLWNTYFTKKSLIKEAEEAEFKVCDIFGNVAGSCYQRNSPTIAILLEK